MFIVPRALLKSSATVIVRAGRAIWFNPFATVLFNVCSGCVWYDYHITLQLFMNLLSFVYLSVRQSVLSSPVYKNTARSYQDIPPSPLEWVGVVVLEV